MEKSPFQLVIEPNRTEKNYYQDLWRYRELFYILSWRDVKVKYKQATLGVLWAVIRPLLTMLILTYVFGKVAGLKAAGTSPYAITVFCGMLPWNFFAVALGEASNSLVSNQNLISKVYFPRLIVPVSSVITALIDFFITFLILIGLFIWYRFVPDVKIFLLPIFIFLAFLASFGPGLWLTALNVKYRDFRFIVPFIVQFGMYVSPVGMTSEAVVPEKYRLLYALNPVVGVIDAFRWCIIPGTEMHWQSFMVSLAVIIFFSYWGIRTFRRMEKTFADLI
jgi:lipopolysaccharide transport system permease protein